MNKAIFLDRDGTINIDKSYLYQIDDFEYLPGVIDALRLLQEAGFLLIIITNQSGIGRGYYTEEDYYKLMDFMTDDLRQLGITITAHYHCPHLPDAQIDRYRTECKCRKPGTQLFEEAIARYDIDLAQSYCIGDRLRDLSPCAEQNKFPGIRGYLLYSGTSANAPEEKQSPYISRVTGGILDAATDILSK